MRVFVVHKIYFNIYLFHIYSCNFWILIWGPKLCYSARIFVFNKSLFSYYCHGKCFRFRHLRLNHSTFYPLYICLMFLRDKMLGINVCILYIFKTIMNGNAILYFSNLLKLFDYGNDYHFTSGINWNVTYEVFPCLNSLTLVCISIQRKKKNVQTLVSVPHYNIFYSLMLFTDIWILAPN